MKFLKFHNCGNDFIVIDNLYSENNNEKIKELSKKILKRRYGIGADNLLYLNKSKKADAFMNIFNITEIEGDNCGNGSLCAGKYLCEKYNQDNINLETLSGILKIKRIDNKKFKTTLGKVEYNKKIKYKLENKEVDIHIANIGEPHAIIINEDIDITSIGNKLNKNLFPEGINVNLVEIQDNKTIKIKTFERSCFKQTEACGTGSCCSAFVCQRLGLIKDNNIDVINKGGKLEVEIQDKKAYLTGKPKLVFKGEINDKTVG